MSHFITPAGVEQIERLTALGKSSRDIVKITGYAKNTVQRYRTKFLSNSKVTCGCGEDIRHQGWCQYRFNNSIVRQAIVRDFNSGRCVDCGGPRAHTSAMRCQTCWDARAYRRKEARENAVRPCKICLKLHKVRRDGVCQKTCGSEWCNRLYTFYYVEGRNRPSTVQGVKNKELKFNFLLSDFLRRCANEQQYGS